MATGDKRKTASGNPFWRHVGALFAGTGASQILTLAAIPFLTKLYEPEEYGTFAAFLAMSMIIGTIATGRYNLAIILPGEDREGASLVTLSTGVTLLCSIIAAGATMVWPEEICKLSNNMDLMPWLPFLPLAIFLYGITQILEGWSNRKARYKRMSAGRLIMVLLIVSIQLSLGVKGVEGGLMIGTLIGQSVSLAIIITLAFMKDDLANLIKQGLPRLKTMAKEYSSHPLHLVPAHGACILYLQLPVLLISSIFGKGAAGWYGLSFRIVLLPTQTLATSIGTVYRQHAAENFRKTGEFLALYKKTLFSTAVLSILPFLALLLFIDDLVLLFLGEKWKEAGELAQILSILGWFCFFSQPVDKGSIIVGKTGYIICWHVARLLALVAAFFICSLTLPGLSKMVVAFSIVGIIFYLVDLFFGYHFAKGKT